jgi:hypothetical protein
MYACLVVQNERYIKHICLPMVLRYDALASFHDTNAGGGHLGVDKVLSALRQRYFWPRMHQTAKDHILSYDRCLRIKVDTAEQ